MGGVRRFLLAAAVPALAAGSLVLAGPAGAAVAFRPCTGARTGALCARVNVPLDRRGVTPGTVSLLVERVPERPRHNGVLIVLAGGPGQAATPLRDAIRDAVSPALRDRELVVFDQRGTGASGLLRCPTVERAEVRDQAAAVGACGARLGARSSLYTTRDSVEDIEAVRQALGVERISLLGVSYGTKVALAYASAHPGHTDRLVLDSPVALDGPDAFGRSSLAAIPRVLSDLCRGRRCLGVTTSPTGELARLAARLRARPLSGTVIGPRGQRRHSVLTETGLLGLVLASDVDPTILPSVPAAAHSALLGDTAPLLRLARTATAVDDPGPPAEFSTAVLVATLCEESSLPWARTASTAQRRAALGAAAASLGDGPFAPFGRRAAIGVSILPACLGWPAAPDAPDLVTTPPPVPTLFVDGTADLRTPLEDGRAIASGLPDARVLAVAGVGHSVLSTATTRCPQRALGAFFAGRPVRRACPRDRLLDIPPDPVAPRSLAAVRPARGLPGRRGRTLGSVILTLADTSAALVTQLPDAVAEIVERGTASVGGLRGGYVTLGLGGIRVHHVIYVPGVTVDGRIRFESDGARINADFTISGSAAAHGTVHLSPDGSADGRLAGRRFALRRVTAAAATAGSPGGDPFAGVVRLRRLLAHERGGRPNFGRPPR